MSTSKKRRWVGRIYLRRNESGKQIFWHVGSFATKRERDDAVAKARVTKPWLSNPRSKKTGDELADRYLKEYAERHKWSSYTTVEMRLRTFRATFGQRIATSITRAEAKDWARTVPASTAASAGALFAWAIGEEEVDGLVRNPFRGLTSFGRSSGRGGQDPPTLEELERLRDATAVLGDYGPQMRDLLDFAALTLLRPGELYELRYPDVDLARNRIRVSRRLYKGGVDVPKNGEPKTIALVPPAREILLRQPTRTRPDGLVFVGLTGCRLAAHSMSLYWQRVTAAAGLGRDVRFYDASKHYGVSRLYRLGLSERAIAAQCGWSVQGVERLLDVYAHRTQTVLSEVDALYVSEGKSAYTRESLSHRIGGL
jgi:integrase